MKPQFWFSATTLTVMATLTLTACSKPAEQEQTASTAAVEPAKAATALVGTEFNSAYKDYLKTLASDEFQGRMPATPG